MIAVMGATGHTGKRIAEALLRAGQRVRALGRSETKLEELERAGAEVMTGDASDAAFLTNAFRGADAVYTLLPPDLHATDYRAKQDRVGEAITRAIRDSGVLFVVVLSSVGAELPDGTGAIVTLHDFEERLNRLENVNVLVLRAGYFFENFHEGLGTIKQQGVMADAVDPNVPVPMIATRDIADVAAGALQARDWRGVVVRELLGQRDLTFADVTRILGARLGRPDLPYVRMSYEDMEALYTQVGLSPDVARMYIGLNRALSDGTVKSLQGRSAENTTPTRFEDYAEELARAYAMA